MKPEAYKHKPTVIGYVIGASIITLALMLFSHLSCSVLGLCTDWISPAGILDFWKVMGISTAILLAGLAIQFLKRLAAKEKNDREVRSEIASTNEGSEGSAVMTSEVIPNEDPHLQTSFNASRLKSANRWKELCDTLTEEEKKSLTNFMEEHYFHVPKNPSAPATYSASNND